MSKKIKKYSKNGDFVTPNLFFTFVPSWCPNFMKKIERTNGQSPRYLKIDHRPTDKGDYIGHFWINRGPNIVNNFLRC